MRTLKFLKSLMKLFNDHVLFQHWTLPSVFECTLKIHSLPKVNSQLNKKDNMSLLNRFQEVENIFREFFVKSSHLIREKLD